MATNTTPGQGGKKYFASWEPHFLGLPIAKSIFLVINKDFEENEL